MKLLLKINLVLLVLFALGIGVTAQVSHRLLQNNAREEMIEQAKLLIDSALAVRSYTSTNIAPLLETQIKYEFRPEMVSAYSAIVLLRNLREANPEYKHFLYREATLNPTNPANRAVDWENDLVQVFRNDATRTSIVGERDTPNGRMLYVAKPLKAGAACLRCHDTADVAPSTMIAKYGTAGGFGWKAGEIIGAQIIQLPDTLARQRADAAFRVFVGSMIVVLLTIALTLNLLLWWLCVRPITKISALADRISLGETEAPDFAITRRDEIGQLSQALSRMRRSLVQAMQMLET